MTNKTSVENIYVYIRNQWLIPLHNVTQGFVFIQIYQNSCTLMFRVYGVSEYEMLEDEEEEEEETAETQGRRKYMLLRTVMGYP